LRPESFEQLIREYFGKQIKAKREISDSKCLSPPLADEFWERLTQTLDLFQNVSSGKKMSGRKSLNKFKYSIAGAMVAT